MVARMSGGVFGGVGPCEDGLGEEGDAAVGWETGAVGEDGVVGDGDGVWDVDGYIAGDVIE